MEAVSSSSGPVPAEESLGKLLKRTEQTLLRAKSAAVKTVGLTLPQYVALVELAARPGITGAELARACLVSPQAMMVVLKAMEEQGLVERTQHPLHQTVLEIHLTRVGREASSAAGERAQPIERRIAEALSSKEPGDSESAAEALYRCRRGHCVKAARDVRPCTRCSSSQFSSSRRLTTDPDPDPLCVRRDIDTPERSSNASSETDTCPECRAGSTPAKPDPKAGRRLLQRLSSDGTSRTRCPRARPAATS